MPLYQYKVRDQTSQTRSGTASAISEMELRGRLQAEGFQVVSTQKQAEDDRPIRMFRYTVRDAEGETRAGTLAEYSEKGVEAMLTNAGYTVVRIVPAVKTWIASSDGDTYRGYVSALPEAPRRSPEQQIRRLLRLNRLLSAVSVGLLALACVLLFLLLHHK